MQCSAASVIKSIASWVSVAELGGLRGSGALGVTCVEDMVREEGAMVREAHPELDEHDLKRNLSPQNS